MNCECFSSYRLLAGSLGSSNEKGTKFSFLGSFVLMKSMYFDASKNVANLRKKRIITPVLPFRSAYEIFFNNLVLSTFLRPVSSGAFFYA